jgi:hypothetical protein
MSENKGYQNEKLVSQVIWEQIMERTGALGLPDKWRLGLVKTIQESVAWAMSRTLENSPHFKELLSTEAPPLVSERELVYRKTLEALVNCSWPTSHTMREIARRALNEGGAWESFPSVQSGLSEGSTLINNMAEPLSTNSAETKPWIPLEVDPDYLMQRLEGNKPVMSESYSVEELEKVSGERTLDGLDNLLKGMALDNIDVNFELIEAQKRIDELEDTLSKVVKHGVPSAMYQGSNDEKLHGRIAEQQERIEELERTINDHEYYNTDAVLKACERIKELDTQVQKLLAETAHYREALDFYAEGDWYCSDIDPCGEVVMDGGAKASEALASTRANTQK